MKGYEAIADALITEGVDTVFGVLSVDNMSLMSYLDNIGLRVVRSRTEHGAVCMADGYTRSSGRPGVAIVGEGPAAGLTGTALLTARKRRSPVLLICPDSPPAQRHAVKNFDQRSFFVTTAGHCVAVAEPATIAEDLRVSFRHIRSGSGPSVFDISLDLFDAGIPGTWTYRSTNEPLQRVHPDPDAVRRAADVLVTAERPIILAGRGAVLSEAREELEKCAEKIGALLGTTVQAPGLFDGNPFYIGTAGTIGTQTATELLQEADCVLAVGASLNVYATDFGRLYENTRIIHIDRLAEAIGAQIPVDVAVVGDAAATMASLNAALESAAFRQGFRTDDVTERIAESRRPRPTTYDSADGVIDPRQLLDALDDALPRDRIVVTDSGHFMFFVADRITLHDPRARIWTADFAALSVGIPIGIGAAMARPDPHCVVFVGDGGFMMSLQELDTAVRHKIPMTVVIMNDEAYGAEVHYLRNRGLPIELAQFETPDLAAVSSDLGCETMTLRHVDDVEAVAARAGKADVPLVVDARIDGSVIHPVFVGARRLGGGE